MFLGKSRNLYLYLALACFVGILAIFVVDGYLGIYDTLYITIQESERKIESDYWQDNWTGRYGYNGGGVWEEPVYFRYKIDNNRFSTYLTSVEVSVWKSGESVLDLVNEDLSLAAFDDITVDWTLRTEELEKQGYGVGEYTIKIEHGTIERKVIWEFHDLDSPGYLKPPVPISR